MAESLIARSDLEQAPLDNKASGLEGLTFRRSRGDGKGVEGSASERQVDEDAERSGVEAGNDESGVDDKVEHRSVSIAAETLLSRSSISLAPEERGDLTPSMSLLMDAESANGMAKVWKALVGGGVPSCAVIKSSVHEDR